MYIPSIVVNKKIVGILAVSSCAFMVIVTRLLYLQIYCADYFMLRSQKNFTRHELIDSPRGNIRDSNGNLLATNRPFTCLVWQGTGKNSLTDEQRDTLSVIEKITGTQLISGQLYEKIVWGERKKQRIIIVSDIDFAVLSKLSELFPNNPNIAIDTKFKRFYPYNNCGSHVVGYLGNIRSLANGQLGLEKIFDADLSGRQGSKQHVVNSAGQRMAHVEVEKAATGSDVHTTIDIEMQQLCEKVFPDNRIGSFILLNPLNGAIVSLVSRPNFDPNIFLDPISSLTWQTLQESNPFLNRALDASYPSGSIFKLVTISAALENNILQANSLWNCKGYTLFGKRKYWCARRSGHGEISMTQAVAESCNTLFFEIGKKIDIDLLAEYAHKFGLGQKTNIVFPEKSGLVPSREWKLDCKGERWWQGETLSVAIGQSFLLVTPMQIARMIGAIFTGYLVSPRLLLDEPVIACPLDIRSDTIAFLKKSMKMVVRHGTGRSVRKIKDIKIYAKTSTAQTSDFAKRKLDEKYLEHGWFVGHFQYKEYDPLVVVIMVERVGAAQVATVIAKNFLVEYKKHMDVLYN
jgi:penicillin-binding protein 2